MAGLARTVRDAFTVLPGSLLMLNALLGVLMAWAFDTSGTAVALPVSLAGWLLLLEGRTLRAAAAHSLAFGIGFFFVLQYWLSPSVGWAAWIALSLVEALFWIPLGVAVVLFRRHLRCWPLWSAAAWVAVEALRASWPFSGMPWGRLSYAVADTAWAEALPWYGFTVVSALVFLSGAVLALTVVVWRQTRTTARPTEQQPAWWRARAWWVPVVALLVVTLLPSVATFPLHRTGTARVAVVQGDVPGAGNDLVAVHREVTDSHADLTVDLGQSIRDGSQDPVDLVIWPENATAVDPFTDVRARSAIERASDAMNTPLLFGGMVDAPDPDHVLNQGIVWEPGVGGTDRYSKQHPVPFGEYIPWRDFLSKTVGRLREVPRDMLSGSRETPLRAGSLLVADAICFDVGYDDALHAQLRNGGQLAVVQTSNAMFIGTDQIDQQFEITRLRAQESGRWLPVAAVNGLSAVIRPDGSVASSTPARTKAVLVTEVETIDTVTWAVRLGNWPGRLAGVLTALGLGLVGWRSRTRRHTDSRVTTWTST